MQDKPIERRTFLERGIQVITLNYKRYDERTGNVRDRQIVLPTDLPVLPELQWLYDDTLRSAQTIREHLGESRDAHFILLDNERRQIGFIGLKMGKVSDRDLALVNCALAEAEGSILALPTESMPNNENHEPRKDHISKRKRRRRRS